MCGWAVNQFDVYWIETDRQPYRHTDNPTDTQTIQSFRIKISLRENIYLPWNI